MSAAALVAPVKAEVRSGLERVSLLPVNTGYAEITAGINNPWSGTLGAFVRGEVGWHPAENVSVFGFAEANTTGFMAGAGANFSFR